MFSVSKAMLCRFSYRHTDEEKFGKFRCHLEDSEFNPSTALCTEFAACGLKVLFKPNTVL